MRNNFVIPLIAEVVKADRKSRIIDVGCGTGYILRLLAQGLSGTSLQLTLLDRDEAMLAFAAQSFIGVPHTEFIHEDLTTYATGVGRARFNFCICSYTALDIENLELFSASLKLLVPTGKILIFIPDSLEDIVEFYLSSKAPSFEKGVSVHRIDKINAFTDRVQTFIARQAIDYVEPMLDKYTLLARVASFKTSRGGRHLALIFDRTKGTGDGRSIPERRSPD